MRVLTGPEGPREDLTDADLRSLYAAPSTPWLRANMVSTLDGAATGETGRSGSINNEVDKRVFDTLRDLADAILVGAGTAEAEGYRPADRPIVLVSRSGRVPERLRDAEPGRVLLATCQAAGGLDQAREQLGAEHVLVMGGHRVDLAELKTPARRPRLAAPALRGRPARAAGTWCTKGFSTSWTRPSYPDSSAATTPGSPTARPSTYPDAARPAPRGAAHPAGPLVPRVVEASPFLVPTHGGSL